MYVSVYEKDRTDKELHKRRKRQATIWEKYVLFLVGVTVRVSAKKERLVIGISVDRNAWYDLFACI